MAKVAADSCPFSISQSPTMRASALTSLTVFCDFDGPIVDVSDRYYHTYRLGLAEVEAADFSKRPLTTLTKSQFWQMKQERTPDVEIAMRSGLRGEQIDFFRERVQHIVNQAALLHEDRLQPGVRWALALLQAQGARLVLVTLRSQAQATQFLREHELDHLFSRVWGMPDQTAAYNNQADHKTELLAQAIEDCKRSQRWAGLACMIGDTEADILAGQAANITTLALTCGIRSQAYLQRFAPNRIHSDLLSAAHYLLVNAQLLAQD
jgi:phosphoglycolate phosphatase